MTVIFDIETDGLYHQATEIHCISIKVDDNLTEVYTSRPIKGSAGSLEDGLDILSKADVLVGHNIINFDIPTIKKLYWTWDTGNAKLLDTLIATKLKYPNIIDKDMKRKTIPTKLKGRYSLKAWGYRLRILKDEFEESWDELTEQMVEYCRQDAEVTYALYHKLLADGLPPQEAIDLEQEFAGIISRQEKYGVLFDIDKAQKLHLDLIKEKERILEELSEIKYIVKQGVEKTPTKNLTRIKGELAPRRITAGVPYCDVTFEPFNLGSRQHITKMLKDKYNWKPTELTDKGTPKVNEDVLNSLPYPEAKSIAKYLTVVKLLGQISEGQNSWLNYYNSETGRIHGGVDTLGAVTRRCTHSRPNIAQVPSGRAYLGKECRELFIVPEGKKIVGCDMSGLELRIFAHYLARHDKGEYAKVILEGDIHTFNQNSAGLPTRDDAKTFIYATLYGAGDAKVGDIVGKDATAGRKLKDKFKKNIPAYALLVAGVEKQVDKTGVLKALDGNPYYIRSKHSALNVLLQGAGALVCKKWCCITDELLSKKYKRGEQYEFIMNIHDEFELECDEDISEDVAKIAQGATTLAGEFYNLRIRLDGDAKIGHTWYDVH